MRNQGILIVDDDEEYRQHLVTELSEDYKVVAGASSCSEAVGLLTQRSSEFQFAVVDHRLANGPDGIETTSKLVEVAPNIYPVVFSNVPVDTSSPRIMKYKYEALTAGAYRYLEWKVEQERRNKEIQDFVREIEQLVSLRDWISDFFMARATAPSLLTQLDVGMTIIDRHYKTWFMNEPLRRMIGLRGTDLPPGPCVSCHGFTYYPCDGCLVQCTLADGKVHDAIFLSPLVFRDKDRVFFLKVWAQPVIDQSGAVILAADEDADGTRHPLAIIESIQDLTDSPELKAMALSRRLKLIARGISRIAREEYSAVKQFDYVRVYVVEGAGNGPSEKFVLSATAGVHSPPLTDDPIELRTLDRENLLAAEKRARTQGSGCAFPVPTGYDPALPHRQRTPYIYFPVVESSQTIALIEAGCAHPDERAAARLKPYAREVQRAIRDNVAAVPEHTVVAAQRVAAIEQELQIKTSPEDQLRTIIKRGCEFTDSHQYVMRYVEGNAAKLVRLKIPRLCGYENLAAPEYELSYDKSWSCRTITARAETLLDIVNDRAAIRDFRTYLDDEARVILGDANGLCYEPLILNGICIGMMGFHSRTATNYRDRKNISIIRSLVAPAKMALHDYMIEQSSREKAQADALSQTLGLLVHNIKTPLAAAGLAFERLLTRMEKLCEPTPDMEGLVSVIKNQLSQISRFRDEVLKLNSPWESRVEMVDLPAFLAERVEDILAASDAEVAVYFLDDPTLTRVLVDKAAMKLCLDVLLQNAMDAMEGSEGERRLEVSLRIATDAENRMIESALTGLAVDVVDNGCGVPDEMAQTLFRSMKSAKPKGFGLGLLHCLGFALSAQGNVYYDESHRDGARFTLVLPYRLEEEGR